MNTVLAVLGVIVAAVIVIALSIWLGKSRKRDLDRAMGKVAPDNKKTRDAKAAADAALDSAVNALYDEAVALADANQYDLLAGELAEFNARGNTIRNNDYNSRAQEFNDTLAGQPAKLIGALWGIEEAEYYR